ncbi:MAG TPA: YdeI/OmpD-associated family protein [Pyrinomonadaceae bacterium]|nr:YdeI/OmpD-associated family protein [Pyrinomonadaceae bacterium]
MEPKFFSTAALFCAWLEKNHERSQELLIGFHKKGSGKKSLTYPEALDEALCFGWIDGVRKSINNTSYTIRFTPRKKKSIWSRVNIRHVERLKSQNRMKPAGLAAFAIRDPKRSGIYLYEKTAQELTPEFQKKFSQDKKAWAFFQEQPPGYRKIAVLYLMSAKKEETRLRRLEQLIALSAKSARLGLISPKKQLKEP